MTVKLGQEVSRRRVTEPGSIHAVLPELRKSARRVAAVLRGVPTQVGPGNETAPAPPGEAWSAALFQAATGPQGLAAMVTFVCHQNPAASPDHAACDRWHVTLLLKHAADGYHIRRHRPGFPLDTFRACH